nr:hypothetical protein [Azonexus sp.]
MSIVIPKPFSCIPLSCKNQPNSTVNKTAATSVVRQIATVRGGLLPKRWASQNHRRIASADFQHFTAVEFA